MKVLPAVAAMLWLMSISVRAQTSDPLLYCSVCGQRIWGTVYVHTNPYLQGKRGICETCAQIKEACSICYLPVKQRFKDLKDGRFLCEQDAKTAVLTIETAETLFRCSRAMAACRRTLSSFGRSPEHGDGPSRPAFSASHPFHGWVDTNAREVGERVHS